MEDAQQSTEVLLRRLLVRARHLGTKKRPERPAEPRSAFDVISAFERLAAPPNKT
jgi:hypothetical protein